MNLDIMTKNLENQFVCKLVLKIDMTNKRNQRISTWHYKARCSQHWECTKYFKTT